MREFWYFKKYRKYRTLCKNTGFYRTSKKIQDITGNTGQLRGLFEAVIDPVIERIAYCGHLDNILLSMITDDCRYIRELGMRQILRSRSRQQRIRQFDVPRLNFWATDYIDMIPVNWLRTTVTKPPLVDRWRIQAGHWSVHCQWWSSTRHRLHKISYIIHKHKIIPTDVKCEALNDRKDIELNDGKHRHCDA